MNSCWFHLHSRQIVQILMNSHFDLVISILALDATEKVFQTVTEMADKHSSHFSSAKEISVKATFFLL